MSGGSCCEVGRRDRPAVLVDVRLAVGVDEDLEALALRVVPADLPEAGAAGPRQRSAVRSLRPALSSRQ
jgi:hypothetical protein